MLPVIDGPQSERLQIKLRFPTFLASGVPLDASQGRIGNLSSSLRFLLGRMKLEPRLNVRPMRKA